MAVLFGTFGPFELRRKSGVVTRDCLKQLWAEVATESKFSDLADGIGVYVLATKTNKGNFRPWYVGLTRGKFRSRFYQHGHNHPGSPFVKLADHVKTGSIYVFLLPRKTSVKKLMKSTVAGKKRVTKVKSITEVEFMLIGRCFAANKNLLNVSEKTFQAGLLVPGVNDLPKKRNNSAAVLAAMIDQSSNNAGKTLWQS